MKDSGIKPSEVTYNNLITSCVVTQEWQRALEVLAEMKQEGIAPSVVTYTSAIKVCIDCKEWTKARELFNEMIRSGLKPDEVFYRCLVHAYAKAGKQVEALKFLEKSKKDGLWVL